MSQIPKECESTASSAGADGRAGEDSDEITVLERKFVLVMGTKRQKYRNPV